MRSTQQARLDEGAFYEIMLQDQLSELRMKRPQIRGVGWRVCPAEHVCCPGHEVLLPVSDLGGMHPEVFGHFRQRLVASDRYQGDLRLKSCPVIPSRPFLTFPQFRGHRSYAHHLP